MSAAPFSDRLLAWFERHGRHDLPWQHPRTPYRVWVSEIMLQQTQVTTVIPYFERFMARFPTLQSLAAAEPDDVLALWSGLGYYARARNLHRAARHCVEHHGDELPTDFDALVALPGIGDSTANAIVSQVTDEPAVVLDGNVRRVVARHAAIEGWPGRSAVHRALWQASEARLPAHRGADYTQAIMDLGATVCTARQPGCERCPVADDCSALVEGRVDAFPGRKPATPVREVTLPLLVIDDGAGRVLLERRPTRGIWGGLWSLPEGEHPAARALPEREHRLTHRRLTLRPAHLSDASTEPGERQAWFRAAEWATLGLPKPIRDLLETHAPEA